MRSLGAPSGDLVPGARDDLATQLQSALEHLYDNVYLQSLPIEPVSGDGHPHGSKGAAVHRLLVQTIEELKPPPTTPAHSHLWRRYRHACMRYLEGKTVGHIAEALAISERQARRDNREALQSIVELLRSRITRREVTQPIGQLTTSANAVQLEEELHRLGTGDGLALTRADEVARGVLDTVTKLAANHNVNIDLRVRHPIPTTHVDRTIVRQIILSELLWVIEMASPAQCIGVTVDADFEAVRVVVSLNLRYGQDNVKPVDPERLAIGVRLAEIHGGTLTKFVESDALFVRLSLPAARVPTVLLVDDNPGMLRLLRRYLGGSAFNVIEAPSAEVALTMARELHPDVITLDVMMPKLDGWETLQALRAHPRTSDIPVLVCSVLKERDLALSLGAAGFLAKPVAQQALLRALAELAAVGLD